ncbi:unnamed protein product [Amoebophrya sp. A120]|nr:unnamed protein product [Amoebophrya sp. A120]|eukprot:GSA120T00002450001.1
MSVPGASNSRAEPLLEQKKQYEKTDLWSLYLLTSSHFLTNVGWQAWQFVVPLYLLSFSADDSSIEYAAVYGLVVMLSTFVLSPRSGAWADRLGPDYRMQIVSVGILVQVVGLCMGLAVILVRSDIVVVEGSNESLELFVCAYACLCLGGILEKAGNVLTLNAVKKDWVPWLFRDADPKALSLANSFVSRADLLAEMLGPLLAAGLCTVAASYFCTQAIADEEREDQAKNIHASTATAYTCGAAILLVGVLNLLSFVPQWLLLQVVWTRASSREAAAELVDEDEDTEVERRSDVVVQRSGSAGLKKSASKSSRRSNENDGRSAWTVFLQQEDEKYWLTICYALLWFNALSPHGVVLTAYLAASGLDPVTLSWFRAAGAGVGAVSVFCFRYFRSQLGVERASAYHLWLLTVCVIAAVSSVVWQKMMSTSSSSETEDDYNGPATGGGITARPSSSGAATSSWLVFLVCVVISRIGLYGFELGDMELSQLLVAPDVRLRVASVESALCTTGTSFIYVMGIFFSTSTTFVYQLSTSAMAVALSTVLFERYRRTYKLEDA